MFGFTFLGNGGASFLGSSCFDEDAPGLKVFRNSVAFPILGKLSFENFRVVEINVSVGFDDTLRALVAAVESIDFDGCRGYGCGRGRERAVWCRYIYMMGDLPLTQGKA